MGSYRTERNVRPGHVGRFARLPVVWAAMFLAVGLGPGPLHAACDALPLDLVLTAGQEARLGSAAFDLVTEIAPGGGDGSGAEPTHEVDLDLLARVLETSTNAPIEGSYLPHLDVDYRLSGPGELTRTGKLVFRVSARGPSYGTTLRLAAMPDVTLALTLAPRADAVQASVGDCPEFPLQLTYRFDVTAPRAGAVAAASTTSANARVNLLGALDPLPAQGSPYNDVWGYSDGSTYLAILGSADGTHFIDVTNPTSPVEIDFIPGPNSGWRDFKDYQNYVYGVTEGFGTGQGMQIIDMSDPLDPLLIDSWDDTFSTVHNIYIDKSIGQAWIVGANSGTRILDLTQDPEVPVEIGSRASPYVHDAYVANDLAYLSEIFDGVHRIVDSSDPTDLQTLSAINTPTFKTHNSWTNDDATLLATTDETNPGGHVGLYDITDKTDPILLGEYQSGTTSLVHNVFFDDDDDERMAMSYYAQGFKYVDVHIPSVPVEIGSYDTYPNNDNNFNGAWGVYPFDSRGYFYIADRQTGLYVLEYVPDGGVLSGRVSDAVSGLPLTQIDMLVLPENVATSTNDDGDYGLHVTAAEVFLQVKAVGYKTRFFSAGEMPVGGRLDVDVEMQPLPTHALSGTVRSSADQSGIAGVFVSILKTTLTATTDANGDYAFPAVPAGQQTVVADVLGFSSGEARPVIADAPNLLDFELEPGRLADDMETNKGWVVAGFGLTSGGWERVDPNGTGGGSVQPEDDHTAAPGVTAFITGQSAPGADTNDNDVEGGIARLTSRPFDAVGLDAARLRYHRWVANTAGIFQAGTLLAEASSDGSNYVQLELQGGNANSWVRREFDLGSLINLTAQTRVRFSAEPGPFDPDFQTLECGIDDVDIVRACPARFSPELADSDVDGTVDVCDACPLDSADDADGDGFCGDADNTPFTNSPSQLDSDADGVGDAADNCDNDPNADQRDLDGDGLGDACDPDLDEDGLIDIADADMDNDGILNPADVCPSVPDPGQQDADDDGEGDLCDPDDGIVQGLRLHAQGLLTWEPEADALTYNLYRGDSGSELLLPFATCRAPGLVTPYYVELDLPIPGDGFFYLVSRTGAQDEGSLGHKSSAAERIVFTPCP